MNFRTRFHYRYIFKDNDGLQISSEQSAGNASYNNCVFSRCLSLWKIRGKHRGIIDYRDLNRKNYKKIKKPKKSEAGRPAENRNDDEQEPAPVNGGDRGRRNDSGAEGGAARVQEPQGAPPAPAPDAQGAPVAPENNGGAAPLTPTDIQLPSTSGVKDLNKGKTTYPSGTSTTTTTTKGDDQSSKEPK